MSASPTRPEAMPAARKRRAAPSERAQQNRTQIDKAGVPLKAIEMARLKLFFGLTKPKSTRSVTPEGHQSALVPFRWERFIYHQMFRPCAYFFEKKLINEHT